MNHVAFSALQSCDVVETGGSQHRPIHASFLWDRVHVRGDIHIKTASLGTSFLPKGHSKEATFVNEIAQQICPSPQTHLQDFPDVESKWAEVNRVCTDTLVLAGAKWGFGQQSRGTLPKFSTKAFCPGQTPKGSAVASKGSQLYNCLRRLGELAIRLNRAQGSRADSRITHQTACKCSRALHILHAPVKWDSKQLPSLLEVSASIQWVKEQAALWEHHKKASRIQAWKEKIKSSEQGSMKHIYHHLKNKSLDEPVNLVLDPQGQILFNPRSAMESINDTWDEVFGANVLHEEPLNVLGVIWPYMDHSIPALELPRLSGSDIQQTIQHRNPMAAPGLDGWRTTDMHCLPIVCCDLIADFFKTLEDNCDSSIPEVLLRVKQVILNKPGPSTPLNKRLITILSPMILAYTGTRFRQLQHWQQHTMPRQLCGGIKGRDMSSISVGLRLELDAAQAQAHDIVGIKLDQSKCFDRIIPSVAGALFLAFGLPKGIVSVFLRMYAGFKKHISYRGWVARRHSTAANGVAQGCSLSLIAINVYMAVWARFMSLIPHVSCRAFIDDAYLWAHIDHIAQLRIALDMTTQWNVLVGQKLNQSKCNLWATSKQARKDAKSLFPEIPLVLEFDALGAIIYTSERNAYCFSHARVEKIRTDIRNIGALPISRKSKAKIIAAKIIPQCSFAAEISDIPKKALSDFQSDIATVLWENRPHWRSKMLVFCFLSQPSFVHPQLSRAYTMLRNFWRFVHGNPEVCQTLERHFAEFSQAKHSIIHHVRNALKLFHMDILPTLHIGIGNVRFHLLDFSFKELRGLFKHLGHQFCYEQSGIKPRKDLVRPTGIIDMHLSLLFKSKYKPPANSRENLIPHFESQIVGCTITNDRRAAAGFIDDPQCRFCCLTKESLFHLTQECDALPSHLQIHHQHELGPNFTNFGIVEHPVAIIDYRLDLSGSDVESSGFFDPALPIARRWTDGSVIFANSFWLVSAAFAVVDEQENCIFSGPVHHVCLSSFAAELHAFMVAVMFCEQRVHVYTDSRTIVDMFEELIKCGFVASHWTHKKWWQRVLDLWVSRSRLVHEPICISWIPAHTCDSFPLDSVDQTVADGLGIELCHLRGNRIADRAAKDCASRSAAIFTDMSVQLEKAIFQRQAQLVQLNKVIGSEEYVRNWYKTRTDDIATHGDSVEKIFPSWPWSSPLSSYTWTPQPLESVAAALRGFFGVHDGNALLHFWLNLRWKTGKEESVSYIELAFLFCHRNGKLERVQLPRDNFVHVQKAVRKSAGIIFHVAKQLILPGEHWATWAHKCGRALPKGSIGFARPWFSLSELTSFANILLDGRNQKLESWAFCPSLCLN